MDEQPVKVRRSWLMILVEVLLVVVIIALLVLIWLPAIVWHNS